MFWRSARSSRSASHGRVHSPDEFTSAAHPSKSSGLSAMHARNAGWTATQMPKACRSASSNTIRRTGWCPDGCCFGCSPKELFHFVLCVAGQCCRPFHCRRNVDASPHGTEAGDKYSAVRKRSTDLSYASRAQGAPVQRGPGFKLATTRLTGLF